MSTNHGDTFDTESFINPNENIVTTRITLHRAVKNLSIELWTLGGQCSGPFVNATTCRSLRPTDACAYPTGAAVDASAVAPMTLSLWREMGFAFQRSRSQNITRMGVVTRVLPANSSLVALRHTETSGSKKLWGLDCATGHRCLGTDDTGRNFVFAVKSPE